MRRGLGAVAGTVTSKAGEPVAGATVTFKTQYLGFPDALPVGTRAQLAELYDDVLAPGVEEHEAGRWAAGGV